MSSRPHDYHNYPPHLLRRTYLNAMRQGHRFACGICGRFIIEHDALGMLTIDHIVPKSKGGSDDYANLQPAHEQCNLNKGNTEPDITFNVYKPAKRWASSLQKQNA